MSISELRNDQWIQIRELLPGKDSDPGRTSRDNRLFVDAVLWIARTGAPWRELPENFGPWNSAFQRYNRWSKSGVWERMFRKLAGDPGFRYVLVDSTIVHARRRPARTRSEEARADAARILSEECKGFGMKMAKEYLSDRYGIVLGSRTMRQLMITCAAWRPRAQRVNDEPSSGPLHAGEVVRWSASKRDWLEGRGAKLSLIYMLDEATGELTARFVRHDSTEENLRLLETYLKRRGRPVTFQADKLSLFQTAPKYGRDCGQRPGSGLDRTNLTQIGRALKELEIGWAPAAGASPGDRLQRSFGLAMNHLLEGLRTADIETLAEANRHFKQHFLVWWNQNLTRQPSTPVDLHRPIGNGQDLSGILSVVSPRLVTWDGGIRFHGKRYQIPSEALPLVREGALVRVEARVDGSTWASYNGSGFAIQECAPQVRPASRARRIVTSGWPDRKRTDWHPTMGRIAGGGPPVWKAAQINRVRVSDRID